MKFKTKVIISVILSLVVGLSVLNFVSFTLLKKEVESRILKEVELYALLYEKKEKLPPYIVISQGTILSENLKPVLKKNGKIFWIDIRYPEKRLKKIALTFFLWETVLLLILSIVTTWILNNYLRKEREIKEYLKLFLLILTHKLGNFLSLQKVNLEILKQKCSEEKVLQRMEEGYSVLKRDLFNILDKIKNFSTETSKKEVNIADIVNRILNNLPEATYKKFSLSLKPALFIIDPNDAESLVFFLIENALKYSQSAVKIRSGTFKGKSYLIICNNISNKTSFQKGKGLGLELVKLICKRYNLKLKIKSKELRKREG